MERTKRRRQSAHEEFLIACHEHRGVIETSQPAGPKAIAKLETSVADVRSLSSERERHLDNRAAASSICRELRRTIYDGGKTVVTSSAFAALDESTAKLMHSPRQSGDKELLADVGAILDKVEPHAAAFADGGLGRNTLTDLRRQIADFLAKKEAQSSAWQNYMATGRAIDEALDSGDEAIAVVMTIVKTSPASSKAVVTRFRLAKRVGPKQAKDEQPAQPDPVPVVPKSA